MDIFKGSKRSPLLDNLRKGELKRFEKSAGIHFKDYHLLNQAFTHRSYSNETIGIHENNERLEFLGDSILGMVISSYLYRVLTDRPEGDLAKIKSIVVSEDSLSEVAKTISLSEFLLIGKGEENSGGREKKALMADCMEAIIGAYYLDVGFAEVQKFILQLLVPMINEVLEDKHKKDYKTLLQEYVQKNYKTYPQYILKDKVGPDHDKTFFMEVAVQGKVMGSGSGKNKKEAEQIAAGQAYEALNKSKV